MSKPILYPYEAVIIVKPDASEDVQKQIFRRNKEVVDQHSGSVYSIETWGKRQLGNQIGKARKGLYFHVAFEADNKAIAELERVMRINENVLRFVHIRLKQGTSLAAHMENFKKEIADGVAKEKEREVKIQQKRAARAAAHNN